MKKQILSSVQEAISAISFLQEKDSLQFLQTLTELLEITYRKEGKILIAGNGGSLCDAMHFAEELTGQFRKKRKALPALALADPSHLSCVANDFGYDQVFARGVEAFGKEEDVLVLLSTSGNSLNLIEAVKMAQKKKVKTVAFLGRTGGKLKGMCDLSWIVEGFETSDRIQEVHMAAIHIVIEALEKKLFYPQERVHEIFSMAK